MNLSGAFDEAFDEAFDGSQPPPKPVPPPEPPKLVYVSEEVFEFVGNSAADEHFKTMLNHMEKFLLDIVGTPVRKYYKER